MYKLSDEVLQETYRTYINCGCDIAKTARKLNLCCSSTLKYRLKVYKSKFKYESEYKNSISFDADATISAFASAGGVCKTAAQTLGIAASTMSNRLSKIQKIMNIDIRDPEKFNEITGAEFRGPKKKKLKEGVYEKIVIGSNDGLYNLANAIVFQALKDYVYYKKKLAKKQNLSADEIMNLQNGAEECENFFKSEWAKMLTNVDLEKLAREKLRRKMKN